MSNKFFILMLLAVLASATAACSTTDNANANINANTAPVVAADTKRPGPDGSVITTSVDANGVRTETRVFHNNPRVAKVVVTTRDGRRTTTVYAPSGESKDLKEDVGDALAATGDKLAEAAGWVGDKAEDVGSATKEGVKTAADKTEDAGQKVGEGAKKVADKTVSGAKKAGSAVKKAVTP
ncbi:MAG TPA: hypothetical protein VMZ30_03685 [Pyrinomonadaceae bacterium]|nr:hypothetical protein [Pyrinomonadaceae bacterium]